MKHLLGYLSKSNFQKSELVELDLLDNLKLDVKNFIDLIIVDVEGQEL